jgi:hypothetical protein
MQSLILWSKSGVEGVMSERRPGPERPPEMTPAAAEHFARLRQARQHIDPFGRYTLRLPDGSTYSATGADLIATAEASVRCVEAIGRGEAPSVIRAAFDRLDRTMDG